MKGTIETKSLRLIKCDPEILEKAIEGNNTLGEFLAVSVPDNWTEFGIEALRYSLNKLMQGPEENGWWTYFSIHKQDNKLIGSGGYKGKPTENGVVELGYEIAHHYRNKGLATEMTEALVLNAFKDANVTAVIAHTLAEENASTNVLTKCGFKKVDEINDPDDGQIWKWELKRQL